MSASRMGFQYVVLRCVPRVDREEFVNVGVVLYCQQADFLEARCHVDRDRLAGSIVLIGCAVLVSRGMWGRWRGRLPQALTAVAFWLALLVVVMALYTWRHDLADFFARL